MSLKLYMKHTQILDLNSVENMGLFCLKYHPISIKRARGCICTRLLCTHVVTSFTVENILSDGRTNISFPPNATISRITSITTIILVTTLWFDTAFTMIADGPSLCWCTHRRIAKTTTGRPTDDGFSRVPVGSPMPVFTTITHLVRLFDRFYLSTRRHATCSPS